MRRQNEAPEMQSRKVREKQTMSYVCG